MKNVLKLTLALAMMLGVSSLYAQKLGRIDTNDIIVSMPEMKELQTNMEAFAKDLNDNLETIQVEFNTKFQEYQKNADKLSDSIKQLKEKELDDISNRIQQFEQIAQQDIQKEQQKMMSPIYEKVKTTINEVAKAGGYSVILPGSALIYVDETTVTDISKDVATKLGVDWDKVTAENAEVAAQ